MLNQVCIAGNLGQDPEVRYTQQGLAITTLNIAVNEFYKDQSGESQKRTYWFRATAFGRTAEIAGEYLHKGSKVGIAGQLVQRTWQDQEGNNRSSVEIRVSQLELLGGGNQSEGSHQPGGPMQSAGRPQQQQSFGDAYEPPPDEGDIPF